MLPGKYSHRRKAWYNFDLNTEKKRGPSQRRRIEGKTNTSKNVKKKRVYVQKHVYFLKTSKSKNYNTRKKKKNTVNISRRRRFEQNKTKMDQEHDHREENPTQKKKGKCKVVFWVRADPYPGYLPRVYPTK